MFYCNTCADKHNYPRSFSQSSGSCEVCGKHAVCYNVPSSALPKPEKVLEIVEHNGLSLQVSRAAIEQGDKLIGFYFDAQNFPQVINRYSVYWFTICEKLKLD